MTSKTLKTKRNVSLTLDKEFIQFCELNEIEDVEKLAKETFKRGFDLLKYGSIPEGELSHQDKGKVVKMEIPKPPPPRMIKEGGKPDPPPEEKPKIVEATRLKSSDAREEFTKMGVITDKKNEKKDLYDE